MKIQNNDRRDADWPMVARRNSQANDRTASRRVADRRDVSATLGSVTTFAPDNLVRRPRRSAIRARVRFAEGAFVALTLGVIAMIWLSSL